MASNSPSSSDRGRGWPLAALAWLAALLATGPAHAQAPAAKRVAVAMFMHEGTTFLPGKVGIDGFEKIKAADMVTRNPYVRGFAHGIRGQDIEIEVLPSPGVVIGQSSKGWITRQSFDTHVGRMIAALKAGPKVDAVFLSLHGAAPVEGVARPEAEIARRFRAVVGPKVPIVGTFDLHGNEDAAFLQRANAALVTKYFPHYDDYGQGERAGHLVADMLRGDYRATTAVRRIPILLPTVRMWTGQAPFSTIAQRALVWEAEKPGAYVSYFFGFPWADTVDAGMSVAIVTNDDQALANRIADDMAALIWRSRKAMVAEKYPLPAEAVALAKADVAAGKGPVVLADYSDRAGDATYILAELLRQRVDHAIIGTIADAAAMQQLRARNVQAGDRVNLMIGGTAGTASGEPVRIEGRFERFVTIRTEMDTDCAVIAFGNGSKLIVSDTLLQLTLPEQFAKAGIAFDRNSVIVLKSRVHFRRGFDDTGIAGAIHIVDPPQPFLGTARLDVLPYRNVKVADFYPYMSARREAEIDAQFGRQMP